MTVYHQVSEGIYQIHLPLPFALRRVNAYLLRDGAGWAVLDTGLNTPDGRQTWQAVWNGLGIGPQNLTRIILTHVHPDHMGLVGWLQALAADAGHSLPAYASPIEADLMGRVWRGADTRDNFPHFLQRGGMPDEMIAAVSRSFAKTWQMTRPHPPQLEAIHPDSELTIGERRFKAIHAPGHSSGQLIFYQAEDNLMLCGDQVLMGITPNIGLWQGDVPNPLDDFLTSLASLRGLAVRVAWPGHRQAIEDWGGRIEGLVNHHQQRLDLTRQALADGSKTAFEVAEVLFQTEAFSVHEWRFAVAESLAHLEYWHLKGDISRQGETVWRYQDNCM